MLFNSYLFVFLFFPLCLLGFYKLAPHRDGLYAKAFLIGMSLWFYGYFNLSYLAIMLLSIAVNYLFYQTMTRARKRWILLCGIGINLSVLFYFKYFDFFLENINQVFSLSLPLRNILLPLGISFFTFQQIGFLVDTYRGEVKCVKFVDYALFVTFFPQLIAGPIVNHNEMLPQFEKIHKTRWDWERACKGFTLFVLGLSKKVLLADTFGRAVDHGYANLSSLQGVDAFLIMIWYTLQLYFDFSGYCDMARGIGQLLGIEIPVNFNAPYKAVDIIDFWKRWHITLNRFFTKYVYIPLGGNRKGTIKMLRNLLLVFLLSGIWHGAGWNYIIWGMLHGILYVCTRVCHLYNEKRHREDNGKAHLMKGLCGRIFTFFYVAFAWIFFRSDSASQALCLIQKLFVGSYQKVNMVLASQLKPDEFWYVLKVIHLDNRPFSPYLLMILITAVGLLMVFFGKTADSISQNMKPKMSFAFGIMFLFVWSVVTFSNVSSFLYFNF